MADLPPSKNVPDLSQVDYSDLRLPMLIMYDRPTDFPENVVIRVWDLTTATNIIHLAASIEEAEAAIPAWFSKLSRHDLDDPKIVAVYL